MNVGGFFFVIVMYVFYIKFFCCIGFWFGCGFVFLSVSFMIGIIFLGGLYVGWLLFGVSNGFFVFYSVMYMMEFVLVLLRGLIVGMSIF